MTSSARLMLQDEEGVEPKIFDTLASIASDVHAALTQDRLNASKSIKLSVSLPLVVDKYLPGLKRLLQVKTLAHHTRLHICRLIEDMEQWYQGHLQGPQEENSIRTENDINKGVWSSIQGSTSNPNELASLSCKLSLLTSLIYDSQRLESTCVSTYRESSLIEGFAIFDDRMPPSSIDALLGLALTCITQEAPFSVFLQHLKWIRSSTSLWSEFDQILLFPRLVELSRILVTQHRSESEAKELYEVKVRELFRKMTDGIHENVFWSVAGASKEIEILSVTLERDIDLSLAYTSISNFIDAIKSFIPQSDTPSSEGENKTSLKSSSQGRSSLRQSFGRSNDSAPKAQNNDSTSAREVKGMSQKSTEAYDSMLRRAFDYAIVSVNSYRPEAFLTTGFAAIISFVNLSFGKDKLDVHCNLLSSAFLLGTLFIQTKSDPGAFESFFLERMVESFETILSWRTEGDSSSSSSVLKLCVEILDFAYHCIKAGNTNRYKFFCWFMPPIYTQVNSLQVSNAGKLGITAEIIGTCLATLQKGNDIDLLLRDGVPMVLSLFREQPTQIAPIMRTVSTKLLQQNNFWTLLTLNFALDLALKNYGSFASPEAVENFFRYLVAKGQRKMIIATNEVCGMALRQPHFFGIRNYVFASFEPDLDAFQALEVTQEEVKSNEKEESSERDDEKEEKTIEKRTEEKTEKTIEKKYKVNPKSRLSMDGVADLLNLLRTVMSMDLKHAGVKKIVGRLLEDVLKALEERRFDSSAIEAFQDHLSRLMLFKNLFPQLLSERAENQSPEELAKLFLNTFPEDVIRDEETMSTLSTLGSRIDHITRQLPNFVHVANTTTGLLNDFLSWTPPSDSPAAHSHQSSTPSSSSSISSASASKADLARRIYYRRKFLDEMVYNHPLNVALRSHLVNMGYHKDFFSKNLEIRVDVDDKRNLDEDFKTSLSALYGEYIDLLKELFPGIKHVTYEGADVPLEDYFVENHRTSFRIEDLRARRNHAVKMIDKRIKTHPNHINLQNRKLSMLTREEGLEETFEKEKLVEGLAPPQRRRYWIRMNNSFWKLAACCGKQISGCYAPNGDHAEKPLENALKSNLCFISLYENRPGKAKTSKTSAQNNSQSNSTANSNEGGKKKKKRAKNKKKNGSEGENNPQNQEILQDEDDDEPEEDSPGLEIENMEVLFTDQGLYVFKLYTNGHHLDTTLAWLQFFKILSASRLVPSVIIPSNFPNTRVFGQLENFVATQMSGSIISFKDNFFEEFGVTSYYDIPVEKIKLGDIVIDEETSEMIHIVDSVDVYTGDLMRSSGSRSRLVQATKFEEVVVSDKENELMRAKQRRKKLQLDLSGLILTETLRKVKQKISETENLKPFLYTIEAFVRYISQYLNLFLETGNRDISLISVGLDLESWNRRKSVVKTQSAQLDESTKSTVVQLIADTIHEEIDQYLHPSALCTMFYESRAQFFELRNHWTSVSKSAYLEPSPLSKDIISQATQESGELTNLNGHLSSEKAKQIKKRDIENSKLGLAMMRSLMAELQTIVSFDTIGRVPLESTVKWIFGNEDRVWRERGGRPGEETLTIFLNFCRTYENDPKQLTLAQQQVRLSTQAQIERDRRASEAAISAQSTSIEPSPTNNETHEDLNISNHAERPSSSNAEEENEEVESISKFQGHHHGNAPWGGLVVFASIPEEDTTESTNEMVSSSLKSGAGASNKEIIAYSMGDYIAPDDYEVITAWVHPNYRSFGLALDLYKRTAYRLWETNAKFVTFDMLLGTVEHITKMSPALYLLDRIGILRKIVVKRKNSHSSETEHGIEKFERLTISLKYLVFAFRLLDLWMRVKALFNKLMHPKKLIAFNWTEYFQKLRRGIEHSMASSLPSENE